MKAVIQQKLDALVARYGLGEAELKPDSMLALAVAAKQACQDIGPFAPAFAHFKKQQIDFEAAAIYLEELQKTSQAVRA